MELENGRLPAGGRQGFVFPLIGALLASGAPLGLLLLRRFALGRRVPVHEEVRHDLGTYLYLTLSTTLTFMLLGRVFGRYVDHLTELSTTDPLTGLANARAFYPRLQQEIERSRRSRSPVSLLLLDVDNLKALNDRHGHAVGDRALRQIARGIRQELRMVDVGARLGGDEFAVLAAAASKSDGRALGERLRRVIADEVSIDLALPVSVSIGVATFDPARSDADWQAFMRTVDEALYTAKNSGRNRVVAAGEVRTLRDG